MLLLSLAVSSKISINRLMEGCNESLEIAGCHFFPKNELISAGAILSVCFNNSFASIMACGVNVLQFIRKS